MVVWTFFGIAFLGTGMKTDLLQSCGHYWVFQICWHVECSTLTASSFKILNSSPGIPSPPLTFFIIMLPKAHSTWHSRMSGSGEWSHHCSPLLSGRRKGPAGLFPWFREAEMYDFSRTKWIPPCCPPKWGDLIELKLWVYHRRGCFKRSAAEYSTWIRSHWNI